MSITVTCDCGNTLTTKNEYAGKKGKCPRCGRILLVPTPDDQGYDLAPISDDDVPPPPPPLPAPSEPAPAPTSTASLPSALLQSATGLRNYLYFVLLLALIPLIVFTSQHNRDELKQRMRATIDHNPGFIEKLEQNRRISKREAFSELPGRRIEGALLPADTDTHWAFALLSAAGFFILLLALFPGAVANAKHLLLTGLFTGTIGILFLLAVQYIADWTQGYWIRGHSIIVLVFYAIKFIGFSYRAALGDTGFLLSFLGFTFGVGLCEELCKALPILWHFQNRGTLSWKAAMLWGLASGIGFGISEGITYSAESYNGVHTGGVYVVRFVSCVTLHAIWAASVSLSIYKMRLAIDSENYVGFLLRVLGIPMILHGLYDTLLKKDMDELALVTAVISFAFMAWQIEVSRRHYPDDDPESSTDPTLA